ncbi:hypothetical protein VTK73DRAFT_3764 [Phialemonium thermophilum]|uniref:CCHC-type domain-containing protein n=1 Tax=Phialemonium thermophilum TaxID=223376 RepID=A0ABR3WXP5_9PEZI
MAPTISGLPNMAPQSTPKTMSSRLMTMRFMQRAAASSNSTPTTPTSESDDGSGSAKKKRKVSHTAAAKGSAATAGPLFDERAVQAALEAEERKREAAIEKRARELGDARWVLDARMPATATAAAARQSTAQAPLNVVQVGFAQIDSAAAAPDTDVGGPGVEVAASVARRVFQPPNAKKKSGSEQESESSSSSSESEETDSEDDDSDGSASEARGREGKRSQRPAQDAERRRRSVSTLSARRKEERARAQQLAEKRRKKEVKLNRLTSISSAGASPFQRASGSAACYSCGKPGHKASDCPTKTSR